MNKSAWEGRESKAAIVARKRRWFRTDKKTGQLSHPCEGDVTVWLGCQYGKEIMQTLQEKEVKETPFAVYYFEWR